MSNKKRWQSRLACLWSVEKLFPDLERATLFAGSIDLPHAFQEYGYLWTWTFADLESRSSAKLAMEKWSVLAHKLRREGKKFVRALERGTKGGAYHIHGITNERWDLNQILEWSRAAGFGRVNVKKIPREQIGYVAKYLGKPGRFTIPKGVRLWASIGFEGVKMSDIRCRIKNLTIHVQDKYPQIISLKRWTLEGVTISEKLLRPDWNGDTREIQVLNITKENVQHIAQLIANGSILCVAEYRTCTARKLEFAEEKKGVPTGKMVVRKIVEHGVEVGNEQITVTEWLPDDADIAAVKPPALKGEPVLVEISQFSRKYGITAKSIRSLANFSGKLA